MGLEIPKYSKSRDGGYYFHAILSRGWDETTPAEIHEP